MNKIYSLALIMVACFATQANAISFADFNKIDKTALSKDASAYYGFVSGFDKLRSFADKYPNAFLSQGERNVVQGASYLSVALWWFAPYIQQLGMNPVSGKTIAKFWISLGMFKAANVLVDKVSERFLTTTDSAGNVTGPDAYGKTLASVGLGYVSTKALVNFVQTKGYLLKAK